MNSPDPAVSLNSALAATLNGERVRAGLTFDALAAESGISKRTLMRLLSTNERTIDVAVLAKLARVFRTTSSRLMIDAEEWLARHEEPGQGPQWLARGSAATEQGPQEQQRHQ